MKTESFTRKDGSEGQTFKLEVGDAVVAQFSAPIVNKEGKYENYSLGVYLVGDEKKSVVYLRLTKSQYESCVKAGDLKGKTITGRAYENKYGKQVGLTIK